MWLHKVILAGLLDFGAIYAGANIRRVYRPTRWCYGALPAIRAPGAPSAPSTQRAWQQLGRRQRLGFLMQNLRGLIHLADREAHTNIVLT